MSKLGNIGFVLTRICSILVLVGALLAPSAASAQTVRGSLSGNVQDASGAVIPKAQITVNDPSTGVVRTTFSSAEGLYNFPELNLGAYDVTVTAPGFGTLVQHGVLVTIGNVSALNLTLKAGSEQMTVNVDASSPTLETQSSDQGGTVQSRQIEELPLALGGVGAFRSPESFEFLLPGTTGPGSASNLTASIYNLRISGSQMQANSDILDGVDQMRSENGSEFDEESPSVEALQEFKVTTGIPEAEFGREEGGIESFVTKSGTNQYHGTAFDIFKNQALDANTWFNDGALAANCAGANDPQCTSLYVKPADGQNDFGVTLGGPVRVPNLYNGKDKLQFFFGWEQIRHTVGGTEISTIPTAKERTGDFTELYDPAAPPSTNSGVINPCDGKPVYAGEIFDPSTQQIINGLPCRLPFAGNKISAPLSNVAQNLLAYIPMPTQSTLINNYYLPYTQPINNTTYTIRIDASPSPRNKVFVSYSSRDNLRTCCTTPALPYPADSISWSQNFITHFARAGWDLILTPNMLNHVSFGYNRSNSECFAFPTFDGVDYAQKVGIGNAPASKNFPNIGFDSRDQFIAWGSGLNDDWVDNGWRLNDSISIQRGRNNYKFGVDYRLQQFSPIAFPTPTLGFSRAQTASDPSNSEFDGNSFASLLLSQVSTGNFGAGLTQSLPRWTSSYYALFFQDDLKVSKVLTLNLGLRWDVDVPRTAAHNYTSNFSPTAIDPEYGIPGALVFGTKYSGNTRWANTYYKDIQPRVGFAYSPFADGKTVIRGGAGLISGPLVYADDGGGMNAGYKIQPAFASSNNFSPAFLADSGYPAYSQPPDLDPGLFNGQALGSNWIRGSQGKPDMLYEWGLQVQRELAQDLILQVGYLGNRAQNLRSSLENPNNIPISAFSLGNNLNASVAGNTLGIAAPFAGFYTLWGSTAPISRALRPFPQYSQIDAGCCLQNDGMSSYNALLVSLNRRFRNGLSLQVSYTYEKSLTNAESEQPEPTTIQNPNNLRQEKALSVQDLPHTLVLAPLYQLPFGKGKAHLNHGVASYAAGGWEIGTVQRYESGVPVTFCCATPIPGWDNSIRYNRVAGQSLKSASYRSGKINPFLAGENSFFNAAAFVDPNSTAVRGTGAYTFGNMPRVTGEVRTQHYDDEDISVMKSTPVREGVTVVIKAEALNLFNRHIFAMPDTNPTDSSFGIPNATVTSPRNIQFTFRVSF